MFPRPPHSLFQVSPACFSIFSIIFSISPFLHVIESQPPLARCRCARSRMEGGQKLAPTKTFQNAPGSSGEPLLGVSGRRHYEDVCRWRRNPGRQWIHEPGECDAATTRCRNTMRRLTESVGVIGDGRGARRAWRKSGGTVEATGTNAWGRAACCTRL